MIRLFLLLTLIPWSTPSWARVAAREEVPLVIRRLERETRVRADGTATDRWLWRIRVQRREGREDVGTRTVRFYKSFESVKVLRAGTWTEGRFKALDASDIQERAVTEESPGFSGLSEEVFSFPDVQEQSEIEFEYEIETRRALEPEFWGQSFVLDAGTYEEFSWKVHSKRPLFDVLQDPQGLLEVKRRQADGEHHLTFRAKSAFGLALAGELDSYVSNSRKILMLASLEKDWKTYGVHSAKLFEERANGKLPKSETDFAASLKGKPVETRIQRVLRRINDKVRYFGDWRTSELMYVPRTLDEISRTRYGDCKDFSLLAVKMLRLAGLDAKPVWILNEDDAPSPDLYRIPTDNAFNHAIVFVVEGDRQWWIDPTNPVARVNYLADEIAGRPGLIMDPAGSRLLPVRKIEATDYRTTTVATVSSVAEGRVRVEMESRYEGFGPVSAGEQIKGDGLDSFVEEHLQRLMPPASVSDVQSKSAEIDPDSGDLRSYKASGRFENFFVRTSAGLGFSPIREDIVERLRNLKLEGRQSDMLLGKVYSYREKVVLKGARRNGDLALDCEVKSPWLDFSQNVSQKPEGVVFESEFSLKESELVLTAKTRLEAAKLQKDLRRCADRILVLFNF